MVKMERAAFGDRPLGRPRSKRRRPQTCLHLAKLEHHFQDETPEPEPLNTNFQRNADPINLISITLLQSRYKSPSKCQREILILSYFMQRTFTTLYAFYAFILYHFSFLSRFFFYLSFSFLSPSHPSVSLSPLSHKNRSLHSQPWVTPNLKSYKNSSM